jgi:ABC-type multidrug transport system ATPase subunit/pSer/pThr/pTyr-binding forkhead associated (FHA) protein
MALRITTTRVTFGWLQTEAQLEVHDAGGMRSVVLDSRALSIGKASDADIVLAAPWIAGQHARLEVIAGAHRVVAVDGAVLLGGAQVADAVLHDGDVLRLPDPATASLVTLVYKNPQAPRIAPVQHFATPPGKALLTIGRAEADIVLDQPLVARHHADLVWEAGHHVLRDGGSAHGTWVNGIRVDGARPLEPNDVVQIGTFRLTYDGDSLDSFDQRGAIRIDARGVGKSIGGKVLLDPTTLSIEPCEFVAIVGASGAGKSTLMMAMCGFERASTGSVAINGDDLYAGYEAYRSMLGYVPQDDILHRTLRVSRALYHAARLRLPADTAPDEISARIASVLAAVDMTEHAHKRIDQLSGGQRKRVSIACELLADPPLLFLDEPTSGLDPGLERKLMYTLRRLADGGRTIVLVTHATANITVCDHIVYLVGGKMVYFGPPAQAPEFFGVTDFADIYACTDEPDKEEERPETWQAKYRESLYHQKYVVERPARAPAAPSVEQRAEKDRRAQTFTLSRWRQLRVLARRYLELMLADRRYLTLLLAQAPIIGLLLALVSQAAGLTGGRIEAKKVVFMMATTGVWFGVINAAREICKESAVLRRERLAGLRAGPYLASKVVVLFGLVLVQSALMLGVVALKIQLPTSGVVLPAPVEIYLTIAFAGLAGLALGLCISAVATTPDRATSLIPIVLIPQVLFAGIMFGLHGITKWMSWLVSSRVAVDALSSIVDTNQLTDKIPLPDEPQYAHTPSVMLTAWAAMVGQAVVFWLLAWWTLRRKR